MKLQGFLRAAFIIVGSSLIAGAQSPNGGMAPSQGTSPANMPSRPDINGPMAQDQSAMSGKVNDRKFLKDAAQGGMTEVELGKLAAQKGTSDEVKQFGQRMVDDHSKANDKLKDVAGQGNVPIATALDSKHQSRIDKLSKLSGDKFDKAYIKDQLKDHENDVRDFQAEAQNGSDPKVKAFASETLPTLQQHLTMVKGLEKNTVKTQTGS